MPKRPRELRRELRLHVSVESPGHHLEKTRPIDRGRVRIDIQVEQLREPPQGGTRATRDNQRSAHSAPLAAITILGAAIGTSRVTAKEFEIAKHLSRRDCDWKIMNTHREQRGRKRVGQEENPNKRLRSSQAINRGILLQGRVKVLRANTGVIDVASASPDVLRIPRRHWHAHAPQSKAQNHGQELVIAASRAKSAIAEAS